MLSEENENPSFSHPPNWSSMSDLDRAHLLVRHYFLKLLAMIDFSDFSLKSVQSLFADIENVLNKDVRLECNKVTKERHLDSVREEIEMTRQKVDFHKNNSENDFPSLIPIQKRNNSSWMSIAPSGRKTRLRSCS